MRQWSMGTLVQIPWEPKDEGIEVKPSIIRCLNDGLEFATVADAARHYMIGASTVQAACKKRRPTKTGLRFVRTEGVRVKSSSVRVREERSGKVYPSIASAAKACMLSRENVAKSIRTGKEIHGWRFTAVTD